MQRSLRLFGLALLAWGATSAAQADSGNGAPSGAHYNLNLIGVSNPKNTDMTGSNGHVIFVSLSGKTKILLCQAGAAGTECEDVQDFQVIDANGTDADGALFALPDPDPESDGTTAYSVFARELGKPGGEGSRLTTCGVTDPGADGIVGTADDETLCSMLPLPLERSTGKSSFENVSKYLLYVYADVDVDGTLDRVPLFDDRLQGVYWDYDNRGLKLVQLRFYACATTVPTDPNGPPVLDTTCQ